MDLSIVIPFYNEEKNVGSILKEVTGALKRIDYEIIAVDNGSSDATGSIIDSFLKKNRRIRKVRVHQNVGYGYGIIQGLNRAKGVIIGWIDGDGQISAEVLLKLYSLAKTREGLFKIKRIGRQDGISRKILSKGYNMLLMLLFRIGTSDVNSKPKLFSKKTYEKLNLTSKDWFIDTELMIKIKKQGLEVYELQAIFKKRRKGASNVSITTVWEFIVNFCKAYFS